MRYVCDGCGKIFIMESDCDVHEERCVPIHKKEAEKLKKQIDALSRENKKAHADNETAKGHIERLVQANGELDDNSAALREINARLSGEIEQLKEDG